MHGDLEGGHVHACADGSFLGIIDFGQAQAGDPRWDLARVSLWDGQQALDALLDGYGRDTTTPDDWEIVFPLYLLAFVIHHATGFVRAGEHKNARGMLEQAGFDSLL